MTKLTPSELSVVHENPGLQRYLESLLQGRQPTPRSWLYERISPDEVLSRWLSKLGSLKQGSAFEQNVYHFDTSQIAKWGPQGGIAPISELMEIVTQGFGNSPIPKAFSTDNWSRAKRELTRMLKARGIEALRPASYSSVVDDMRARDTLESNSGWPLFTRRNKPEVKESSIRDAESGAWKSYPAIALFRNYNLKTRLVWMFPMSTNLVEGSYFQVLQSAMIRANFSYLAPWVGFSAVRDLITQQYNRGQCISASDFSATDAHFLLHSSLEVYEVLAPLFQARYRDGLRDSLVHMHEIPLVIGPEDKIIGMHGVSSGSNWTNFIETVFDWIFSLYVQYELGLSYPTGLSAIGDDMAWVFDRYRESFSQELERLGKDVGQEIKAEKTTNDRDKVKFLQRLFQRGYSDHNEIRAVYSTVRALKSSVYPERFHNPKMWSSDMFCARQFMILENCVDHPLFEEFVKFVCAGQKDLVPFARKSRRQLDEIRRESKLLPGLNPTYNQERKDHSFADFQSIKLAAKL